MNIEHKSPEGKITFHKVKETKGKGFITECGKDTTVHPEHWTKSNEPVTCKRCL